MPLDSFVFFDKPQANILKGILPIGIPNNFAPPGKWQL